MKKIYLVIILSLLSFQITYAQAPVIQWQNTIGGSGDEVLYIIQQTSDGGYIVGGYSESGISGDKTEGICGEQDYWIVKLDATGQTIEWDKTIGGSKTDVLTTIQQTTDGGYILGGWSNSEISGDKIEGTVGTQGNHDYWIVKLDATGQTIEWQNTIGGSSTDQLYSIQQTTDGGYIMGGASGGDYWIVKVDTTGQNVDWDKTIGGSGSDWFKSIQQTIDGGYIIGGNSNSGISGDKTEAVRGDYDYWIVKLDATGQTIEWDKTIGGSSADYLHAGIHQTADGGYIFGGISWSGISGDKTETNINDSGDYWVIKLDATGQTINWQNSIGGSKEDTMVSLQQTTDGGYILGGYSNSNISGDKTENSIGARDYWVVKLNAEPCINGSIIYNTETGKFNFCEDGVWVEK